MRAWRFQGVGEGIEFSNLQHVQAKFDPKSGGKVASEKVKDSDLVKISKGEEPFFWYLPAAKKHDEVLEINDVDDDVVSDQVSQNPVAAQTAAVFYCKTCGASFLKYRNLAAHVDSEKCKKRPETVSLLDYALGLFKDQLEETQQAIALLPLSDSIRALQTGTDKELPKGWALRMTRKGGRYPEKSKLFVKNKFEEAMSQKKKIRGEEVELLMKADATIAPEERMTLDQIRNFIRTLAAPIKPKRTRGSRSVPVYTDEDGFVEEEVDVPEEEHQYTDDDLYIHVNDHADDYFKEVTNPEDSTDNGDDYL